MALAHHPRVGKLAFTGSVPTGRAVMGAAAKGIKNISLESGGKSPFLVFADSDIEAAVERIMFGIFWNQGQACSATSRVLVEASLYDRLLERLVVESRRIAIGDGMRAGIRLGPLVSEGQYRKITNLIAEGQHDGARLVSGGRRPKGFDRGYFLEPTIFDRVPDSASIWREAIFGPVVCVRLGARRRRWLWPTIRVSAWRAPSCPPIRRVAVGSRRAWMPASSGSIARSRRSPRRRGGRETERHRPGTRPLGPGELSLGQTGDRLYGDHGMRLVSA